METILAALAAFVGGALVSWVNFLLLRALMKGKGETGITVASPVRMLMSAAYLLILYMIGKHTELSLTGLLVGGALGLTVTLLFFTLLPAVLFGVFHGFGHVHILKHMEARTAVLLRAREIDRRRHTERHRDMEIQFAVSPEPVDGERPQRRLEPALNRLKPGWKIRFDNDVFA